MIELFIDGRAVDLPPDCSLTLSASLEDIVTPGNIKEKAYPLSIPMTPRNRSVLQFAEQAFSIRRFNQENHFGKIQCKGATLSEGDVELVSCESDGGSGYYKLRLVVRPPRWAIDAAEKKLSDTGIVYTGTLNSTTIRESWTSDLPVKFLPVKRDRYPAYAKTQTTLTALGYENYHPFVQVKALLDGIVHSSGYRIESKFLNEPFFQSLYMSGRYAGSESSESVLRMNFIARKTSADRTTTADSEGRIYASDSIASHSVGNPVNESDTNPSSMTFGKSFRTIAGRPAFVPEEDAIVGFEFQFKVKFTLTFYSETFLKGPSKIMWDEEMLYETPYPNPLTDKKNSGGNAGYYRVVAFDNSFTNKRLVYYALNGSSYSYNFREQAQQVYFSHAFTRAVCEQYQNGRYVETGDWALYEEADYNQLGSLDKELDLVVRSLPLTRPKNQPVYFDTVMFDGALSGSDFTLRSGSTIRPVFYSMPEPGARITFASLFAHEKSQLKLIDGVAHLFGLHFYTDELTKTIYAEPRFTFLNNTHEIDWTDKIDPEQPVVWEEPGSERHEKEVLLYKTGDAAAGRKSIGMGTSYGAWSTTINNRFTRPEEKKYPNPLFNTTLDEKNSLESAPDASMIVAGDRDERDGTSYFPEKIVRYLGMKPLPDGQQWGWPSYAQEYPLAMFHSAGEDWFTLRFDDLDGQLGLKNYHKPFYEWVNNGKKLTLFLRLTPSDMEAILYPNSTNRDFRGNFTFRIRGEKFRGRLLEVSGYHPDGGSTRCVFTVEL